MRVLRVIVPAMLGVVLFAGPAHAATVTVESDMTPDNVNPKGPAGSGGTITVDVDTDTNNMCWIVELKGLTEPVTTVHIHDTFQGSDDPVVIELKGLAGCLNALESAFIVSNAGRHDIDVHTASFPNAALRGKFTYVGDPGKGSPAAAERIKAQLVKTPVGTETDFTPKEASGALVAEGVTTKGAQEEDRTADAAAASTAAVPATAAPEAAIARTGAGAAVPLSVLGLGLAGLGVFARRVSRRR